MRYNQHALESSTDTLHGIAKFSVMDRAAGARELARQPAAEVQLTEYSR
jgi:hypothetical protein